MLNFKKKLNTVGVGMLTLTVSYLPALAYAEETDLSISGFATFGYTQAIDEDAKPNGSGGEYVGLEGVTEKGEYRDLNKFGLRLNADLHNDLLFGAQMTVNGEDDYDPQFDWLYVQYNFTPNVSLKLGRVTAPLFMYSDFLDATYAYQWLEAPNAVYATGTTVKTNEGFMLDWKANMGNGWTSLVTVFGGQIDEFVTTLNTDVQIDNGLGVAWDVEYEWLRLRAVHYEGKSSVNVVGAEVASTIDGAINQVNQRIREQLAVLKVITPMPESDPTILFLEGTLAANSMSYATLDSYSDVAWEDSDASYTGFGFGLDFESVFFNAEATRVDIEDTIAVGLLDSWYAMIGTRLPGNVSLAFTYSEDKDEGTEYDYAELTADLGAYGSIVDPTLAAGYQQAIQQVVAGLSQNFESSRYQDSATYTLSARWDFHSSASLKAEYSVQDQYELDFNLNEIHRKPSAYRVGIDLVF